MAAKTLRVRSAPGWNTKPLADLPENRLTAEEVDDNFLAAERAAGGPVFDWAAYAAAAGGDWAVGWDNAMAAIVAAGGGILQAPAGVTDIGRALQDTGRANAQLTLPSLHVLNAEQITVVIRGVRPPPTTFSVIGDYPVPSAHSVVRSTLATGSGGWLLGCMGPVGSAENFSGVNVRLENVTFRMPANPTHGAVDLSHVSGCEVDNVVVDTGTYWVQGLAQPTTAASYGIKFPKNANGADTRIGCLNVFGFYTGAWISEHTNAQQMNFWGCLRALESTALAHHASYIQRLMTVHCPRGIVATGGKHYLHVDQFNIEHAASGWWAPVYDIDDAGSNLRGHIKWHIVKAGVGVDSTFLVNGAAELDYSELGIPLSLKGRAAGVSRSLEALDSGRLVQMTNTAPATLTVQPDATLFFPEGTEVHIRQASTGSVTIAAGAGVTIQKPASQTMVLKEQFAVVTLKKLGANGWALFGMLGAA